MPKRRLILLATLTLAAFAAPVWYALLAHPGVTKANFDRIQLGMTKAEVEEIFGGKGMQMPLCGFARPEPPESYDVFFWPDGGGSAALVTIMDDSVMSKTWLQSNEPTIEKIRRWLHLT